MGPARVATDAQRLGPQGSSRGQASRPAPAVVFATANPATFHLGKKVVNRFPTLILRARGHS